MNPAHPGNVCMGCGAVIYKDPPFTCHFCDKKEPRRLAADTTLPITTPTPAVQPEPPPKPAKGDLWLSVISQEADPGLCELFKARRQMGIEKYGTPLQAKNGRNAANDLMQELLDSIVYAEQVMVESAYHSGMWWWARGIQQNSKFALREPLNLQAHERAQIAAYGGGE